MPSSLDVPKISILVATSNSASLLANFLESLSLQEWTDWELLILDNASKDNSAEIVMNFRRHLLGMSHRVIWSSQPDLGIYDAWNRGIGLARGKYLCFIGSDDTFVSSKSLGLIAQLATTSADLILARNAYYSRKGRFLRFWGFSWEWKRMRQSMNIAHPGMLIRAELFASYGLFDIRYRICGDYEWLLRLSSGLRSVYTTDAILKIAQSGVSHTNIARVYAETFRAQRRHIGILSGVVCWVLNWLKYGRRRLIGLA